MSQTETPVPSISVTKRLVDVATPLSRQAILALTGRSSVAALGATFAMVGLTLWLSPTLLPLMLGLGVAILITHTPNLRRLWRGQEGKVVRPVRWSRTPTASGQQVLDEAPAGPGAPLPSGWPQSA